MCWPDFSKLMRTVSSAVAQGVAIHVKMSVDGSFLCRVRIRQVISGRCDNDMCRVRGRMKIRRDGSRGTRRLQDTLAQL